MATVQESVNMIQALRGVNGVFIVDPEGIMIWSSLNDEATELYVEPVGQLAIIARNIVQGRDTEYEFTFLRVKYRKHEILIAPDPEFVIVVIRSTG